MTTCVGILRAQRGWLRDLFTSDETGQTQEAEGERLTRQTHDSSISKERDDKSHASLVYRNCPWVLLCPGSSGGYWEGGGIAEGANRL